MFETSPELERLTGQIGSPEPVRFAGAPGWHFCVLPLREIGHLASAAGETEGRARLRCIGEAAEILSVRGRAADGAFQARLVDGGGEANIPREVAVSDDPAAVADAGSEGAAAGPDLARAWHAAGWERIERAAVFEWWTGAAEAREVDREWTADAGLFALHAAARGGAEEARRLHFLAVGDGHAARLLIAVLADRDGGSPVLGFGAGQDPIVAASKALSEALQMELGLAISRHVLRMREDPAHRRVAERARSLEGTRAPLIAGHGAPMRPTPHEGSESDALSRLLGEGAAYVDLTRVEIGVSVARVIAPALPTARPLKFMDGPAPL